MAALTPVEVAVHVGRRRSRQRAAGESFKLTLKEKKGLKCEKCGHLLVTIIYLLNFK